MSVKDVVTRDVTNGSIVLMHDIHPLTAKALPLMLTLLSSEGYKIITVSELLTLEKESSIDPYYEKTAKR